MGINISLVTGDLREIPGSDWDSVRHQGDLSFTGLAITLPLLQRDWSDVDVWRPAPGTFMQWRQAIADWRLRMGWDIMNTGRWEHMMDVLEARPDVWVCVSH